MQAQTEQAAYLQKSKAWNWQWPLGGNRWETGKSPVKASPKTLFTSTGPSKRTRNKRAAKALRGRH